MLKDGNIFSEHFYQGAGMSLQLKKAVRKIVVLSLLLLSLTSVAHATEGGGSASHNGAEDFMTGAAPPPGNYFINYFNYYAADKFKNDSGKTVDGFDLKAAANVFRFIHMTDKTFLGANWGMHAFIPLVYMDVKLDPPIAPFKMEDSRGSLGDIIVDPFILAWHGPSWHVTTAMDIYIPTGNYDKKKLANAGRNYWTFEPIVAATFLPGAGFDISAKLMYDFNTTNEDPSSPQYSHKYKSGQEFHADFAVGKKMGDFTGGLAGYYYQQTTEDEGNGDKIDNKGRVIGLGPVLKYDYKNMSFTLKYMAETEAKNRPSGDNFWFKFLYAF